MLKTFQQGDCLKYLYQKASQLFLLMRSSSRARSAELVSPNLFSSAIAHLQNQNNFEIKIIAATINTIPTKKVRQPTAFLWFTSC